ncbi:MAG: ATP-binding protein, partial [Alphaproteobacteria bacterium]
ATLFMRNQVSPIKRLARAADNFGKGRDAPDFRPSGATEVRQAATAFLAMRDRIKRQIQQRTEMLAGVSHDLRTPLTRMKLQLAMFKKNPEIDDLSADVAEMERMVNGYLDFARGEGSEAPTRTDIIPVLEAVVHDARRAGVTIDLTAQGPLELPLRQDAFRRCMTNLISNAARYGQRIVIAADRDGNTLKITVDDDGPGIPAAKREEAFRPFQRLDESRSPDTSGTGLGLSIARDIVHGHGGEISLAQSPLGGLRAVVSLPL